LARACIYSSMGLPANHSADAKPDFADHVAIVGVVQGDREMFEVLVKRYNQLLYRVGISYLRQHESVEDAMQNAYLKAFLNLRRFRQGASFSTWLTRIMINECLMELRRRKSRPELARTNEDVIEQLPSVEPAADAGVGTADLKLLLERTVAELPLRARTVYILREVQHLTTAETATALGLSQQNVKVSLHRAREMLKARLLQSTAGAELFRYDGLFCQWMRGRVMSAIRDLA